MTSAEPQPPEVAQLVSDMHVEVTHRFDAPVDLVWRLLSDVERMAGLGPEHFAATWDGEQRGVGATFLGKNRRDGFEWEVPCFVTEYAPPRRFAWTVLEPENPSSRWSYTLSSDDDGTIVVQRFEHGPNYSFIRLWARNGRQKPSRWSRVAPPCLNPT
jgi:uncharacterized protein YndB with AHSA1/START domain